MIQRCSGKLKKRRNPLKKLLIKSSKAQKRQLKKLETSRAQISQKAPKEDGNAMKISRKLLSKAQIYSQESSKTLKRLKKLPK
jgi:hypothetical protein